MSVGRGGRRGVVGGRGGGGAGGIRLARKNTANYTYDFYCK